MPPRTTRLLLVRHGATQLTAEDRFSGSVGVDLSDEGRAQVARLAERLADEPIARRLLQPPRRARSRPPRSWPGRTGCRWSSATACARSATAAGRG